MSVLRRSSNIRLLPLTIATMAIMLCAKLYDIADKGNQFSQIILGSNAIAQEAASADNIPEATDDEETVAAPAPEESTLQPVEEDEVPLADKREFSDVEVSILQSLAKRREALDTLEEEIRMKENLLDAAELRLDSKISQLQALEKTVRGLLSNYEEKEDSQIRSLVKIYENMKPKEAARIFDEMEMPILLLVVDRMSERRAAPVLARMSPQKAKELTVELAENQKLRAQKEAELNNIANQ